jgi:hypothetical protein
MVVSCSEILEVQCSIAEVSGDKKHSLTLRPLPHKLACLQFVPLFLIERQIKLKLTVYRHLMPFLIPLKFLKCPVPLLTH